LPDALFDADVDLDSDIDADSRSHRQHSLGGHDRDTAPGRRDVYRRVRDVHFLRQEIPVLLAASDSHPPRRCHTLDFASRSLDDFGNLHYRFSQTGTFPYYCAAHRTIFERATIYVDP
jgi:hypothetical protein